MGSKPTFAAPTSMIDADLVPAPDLRFKARDLAAQGLDLARVVRRDDGAFYRGIPEQPRLARHHPVFGGGLALPLMAEGAGKPLAETDFAGGLPWRPMRCHRATSDPDVMNCDPGLALGFLDGCGAVLWSVTGCIRGGGVGPTVRACAGVRRAIRSPCPVPPFVIA